MRYSSYTYRSSFYHLALCPMLYYVFVVDSCTHSRYHFSVHAINFNRSFIFRENRKDVSSKWNPPLLHAYICHSFMCIVANSIWFNWLIVRISFCIQFFYSDAGESESENIITWESHVIPCSGWGGHSLKETLLLVRNATHSFIS